MSMLMIIVEDGESLEECTEARVKDEGDESDVGRPTVIMPESSSRLRTARERRSRSCQRRDRNEEWLSSGARY